MEILAKTTKIRQIAHIFPITSSGLGIKKRIEIVKSMRKNDEAWKNLIQSDYCHHVKYAGLKYYNRESCRNPDDSRRASGILNFIYRRQQKTCAR